MTWALSAADAPTILAVAEARIGEGYRSFNFKMGALAPDEDVARVVGVAEKLTDTAQWVLSSGVTVVARSSRAVVSRAS